MNTDDIARQLRAGASVVRYCRGRPAMALLRDLAASTGDTDTIDAIVREIGRACDAGLIGSSGEGTLLKYAAGKRAAIIRHEMKFRVDATRAAS